MRLNIKTMKAPVLKSLKFSSSRHRTSLAMFSEDIESDQEVEESESVEEGSAVEEEVAKPSGISSITTSSQEVEESESESVDSTEAAELSTGEEIVAGTLELVQKITRLYKVES